MKIKKIVFQIFDDLTARGRTLLGLLGLLAFQSAVLAGPFEDNQYLLQQITQKLRENLDREDALPIYRSTFTDWMTKVPQIEKSLNLPTDQFENLLAKEVHTPGMSHLAFYKLADGTLGMEIANQDGPYIITKIYPNGPAGKMGLTIGQTVLGIDGLDPQKGIDRVLPTETPSVVRVMKNGSPVNLTLFRMSKEAVLAGKMGVTTQKEDDGTIILTTVSKNSAAQMAGLAVGDHVLSIDGEIPRKRLDRGNAPGVTATFKVKKVSGDIIETNLTFQGLATQKVPKFQVLSGSEKQAVYLSIPNFSQFYDPNIIHAAMIEAEKAGILVVDLRGNGGGRSDHFLSYLLAPQTELCAQVGIKFDPPQLAGHKKNMAELKEMLEISLGRIISLYLSLSPQNREQLLSSFKDWGNEAIHQTKIFHKIPVKLQTLLEERTTALQEILDGNKNCSQSEGLHLWQEETNQKLTKVLSLPLVQTHSCQIPPHQNIHQWKSFHGVWGQTPNQPTFPYHGKVFFLVDEETYCSAEACAIVPLEYQSFQKKGKVKGLPYHHQLNAQTIKVIGQTKGGAQGRGYTTLKTPSSSYHIMYPLYDLFTPVHHKRIEGMGIRKGTHTKKEKTLDWDIELPPATTPPPSSPSLENVLEPELLKRIFES